MRLDGEDWLHFFNAYERDAWRLETQPVYQMPEEEAEFAHFMATGEIPVADDDEWLVRLRHFRSTGRTIGRVHVLTRPLTDYLRFEMAFYAYSSEAGEDIRILDLTDRENPGLPPQDFWMLDDHVVDMRYDVDGRQTGRFLLEDPDLEQYRAWKRLAIESSVPVADYKAEYLTL